MQKHATHIVFDFRGRAIRNLEFGTLEPNVAWREMIKRLSATSFESRVSGDEHEERQNIN